MSLLTIRRRGRIVTVTFFLHPWQYNERSGSSAQEP